MKRILNSLVFCFFTVFSIAQIDTGFIGHLYSNNLKAEHSAYLKSLPSLSDSANYFRAKYSLKYGDDSLFMHTFQKSKLICMADTALVKAASTYFLTKDSKSRSKRWFGSLEENKVQSSFSHIYRVSERPDLYAKEELPDGLRTSFSKYKRSYKKKAWAAAALSAVLPGAGKLYAGKTKTFFLAFLLNAAYAAQTYESSQRLGMRHPFTIVNATSFAVFYLANVYGSYHSVIEIRKERKKQFLEDAARFYN